MKSIKVKNAFDSNRFIYFASKVVCYLFVTFEKCKGNYCYAITTSCDFLRFILGLALSICGFLDIAAIPLTTTSSRPIILEMSLLFASKFRTMMPILLICTGFCNRYSYFEFIKALDFVDQKVHYYLFLCFVI